MIIILASIPASVCVVPNQPGGHLHYNLRLSAFEVSGWLLSVLYGAGAQLA
jgi:hypothetical protein